jgi:hypothetical protein
MDAEQAITTLMIRAEIHANRDYEDQLTQGSLLGGPFRRTAEREKLGFDIDQTKVDPSMKDKLPKIARVAIRKAMDDFPSEFGSLLLGYAIRNGHIHNVFD